MADPASIRTNNPGAQWYGPVAKQYGASGSESLPGGNNAAIFDDPVNGAAAQFALLQKNYTGMPLSGAISKWSGGNSSPGYTAFIQKQTGLASDTVLTPDLLAGPQGVALAKAQAHWEAGREYPLSDDQWRDAQARALGGAAPASSGPGQPSTAPAAAASPQSPAAAPGSPAPAGVSSPGAGMLAGADLSSPQPDIGLLVQRAMAMTQPPRAPVAPLSPIAMPVPAGLRARLQAAALGNPQGAA